MPVGVVSGFSSLFARRTAGPLLGRRGARTRHDTREWRGRTAGPSAALRSARDETGIEGTREKRKYVYLCLKRSRKLYTKIPTTALIRAEIATCGQLHCRL